MISVIVPVHDASKCLKGCLDSILSQTESLFELILVDDGSTDDSLKICDQYARQDPRVKIFHKSNGGASSARNLGLENAQGDWVIFADADDELPPDAISVLSQNIGNDTILSIGGYEVFDDCGKRTFSVDERLVETLSIMECLVQMYHPKYYYYQGYLWNKLFKREIIETNNLRFDERIFFNEDRLFVVQYLCSSLGTIIFNTSPVYKYYNRASGAMSSLEEGFNYRYVTDFDAYIKMLSCIETHTDDKNLTIMAKNGVLKSYQDITSMMKRFSVVDKELTGYLKMNMRQALGWFYYEFCLKSRYRKFKQMAKHALIHLCHEGI